MLKSIFSKILHTVITLFGVVSVIFLLFQIVPGDPAQMMLDQNENSEQLAIIKKKYGFDKPTWKQYLYYINDLSPISIHSKNTNDFTYLSKKKYNYLPLYSTKNNALILKMPYLRESFQKKGKTVTSIITDTLPNTFLLAFASIIIAVVFGIILGVISALLKDYWVDKWILFLSTLGISLPSFFSAILFSWFFGFVLKDFTGLEMNGSLYEVDDLGKHIFIQWKNLILPAVVLGIRPLAVISQLMRNALLDVLSKDYIRTARAKGLSEIQIIRKHAIKNALNPVSTAVSGWFAGMLGGAVFVEYIFGWNGIGKEIVNALNAQDLPVIMGSVLVIATFFVTINILLNFLYAYLDPRIKL